MCCSFVVLLWLLTSPRISLSTNPTVWSARIWIAGIVGKIHEEREGQGYRGCISYDCLGAGQRVTQEVFKGRSWRNEPSLIAPMTEAFVSMLRLHRLLSLLDTASNLPLTLEEIDQFDQFMDEFSPEDGWNEDLLERFEESGAEKRVRAFLMSLRHHVV